MNQTILEQIEAMLRDRKRRLRRVSLLLCLALLVSMGTVFTMTAQGQTMNNKVRELDCAYTHFADEVLHVHNDDCYDENGALICPLSEKNPHTHSESCWEDRLELVCGLEENKEHLHDESCYELTRVLACGLEETHFHSDSCYDENGSLICGLRGAVWHSHTADCFTERVENGEASEETLRGLEGRDYPAQVFEAEAGGVRVTVRADAGALPMGTTMVVTPVAAETVLDAVAGAVEGQVRELQALDICFVDEAGEELEPLIPVRVSLGAPVVAEAAAEETEELVIVHVDDAGEASVVEQTPPPTFAELPAEDEVMFETGGFSVYVLVKTEQITKKVVTDDGETYTVTVSYTAEAGIPADAELNVAELKPGMADYDAYLEASEEALGWESGSAAYARLFDISLMKDGAELQPAEGSLLHVVIRLDDKAADAEPSVVHFGQETEVLAAETGEDTVSFETGGFSVYAIVDAPEPVQTPEPTTVADLTDLSEHAGEAILLSVKSPSAYFTSALNSNNAFVTSTDITAAAEWYFEPVAGQANRYRIYTLINGVPQYIKNTSGNLAGLVQSGGSEFELSEAGDGTFYAKLSGANKWLQYSKSGGGIRFWTDNKDAVNPKITLTLASSLTVPQDPYGLDGQTFGLAYHNDSAVSAAVMARSAGDTKLAAQSMLMQPDVLDNEGILLVAKNSDITDWTFESIEEDKYYITATVDGVKKYLTINGSSVTLEETPNATNSVIRAIPGTGANSGLWHFTVNGYSLNYTSSGFNAATGSGGTTWLNTVERSVLTDEDFKLYYAQKVSVSDEDKVFDQVVNGDEGPTREQSQVVVYTRVWNEETLRYEFYAVDHDGSLIRCYDAGDRIQWIGSRVNTAVWTFTEYRYEDGTPNYYYELQNAQYGNYIAPQLADGQVMSDAAIGINLPGRRDGYNYTKLVAWDDVNYQYVGLKVENGRLVPCPLEEAEDFYFALSSVVDSDPAEELSTVTTVDNIDYGISMKMINFDNLPLKDGRDKVQTAFFGVTDNNQMGLLSTNLGADGYPMTTADKTGHAVSLAQLFNEMQDVNHLFLKSIHNESGYFEYDSTQNFAHLEDNGNFTVYDQIAAIGTASGPTRTHGQFMPYNELVPGQFAVVTNQTDVMRNPLPDSDPRKGERLYLIPQDAADYFFGMELSASFTQTPNGLDDWGHDIIFEFSGDDDFWLYVDGELTLDLGGVHSASEGSVNFRTGAVTYKRYEGSASNPRYTTYNTTLREIFKKNYLARGMSDAQAEAKLNELFVLSDEGNYVFSEFTRHTMKIYYMERGAGASNLHMRFNLASVKPGTVVLSKEVSGAASPTSAMAEFPYQVHYLMRTMENGEFLTDPSYIPAEGEEPHYLTTEHILVPGENGVTAYYAGTIRPADFRSEYTAPDGVTYHNVFMLKPGEKIEIKFPDNAMQYAVVECGVNPDVFDSVSVNGVSDGLEIGTVNPVSNVTDPETGAAVPSYHDPETSVVDTESDYAPTSNRLDYGVPYMMVNERPRLAYDNHIDPDALRTLTLTKKLYDRDGDTILHYPESADDESETADDTTFSFRLYLGSENVGADEDLPAANLVNYFVKNAANEYCEWNAALQRFRSLGKSDFDSLTDAEKTRATFKTSMNGSISKIPAGYSVELRDVIVSSQYMVEERYDEIPKGYTLRITDGYTRLDGGEQPQGNTAYRDTVQKNEDPKVEVRNQKGWGLTSNKVWTDKDFMASHDPIYFAVYVMDNGELKLLEELDPDNGSSVRQLANGETSVYYFFLNLLAGKSFQDYCVREVTVEPRPGETLSVNADTGVVTNYATVTPVGDTLTLNGIHVDGRTEQNEYEVIYREGIPTGRNENVREDTVTNSRPGIELYKTDWNGDPLSGAVFTLTGLADTSGNPVTLPSYTSGQDGLVTVAYLPEGVYTLTEIAAPQGYVVNDAPLTITVAADGSVSFGGDALFSVDTSDTRMKATVRIQNMSTGFRARKIDSQSHAGLRDVHFALYKQVQDTNGNLVKDYLPMTDFENLVTDENGLIPNVNEDLPVGTYYLTEITPPSGYAPLGEDVCFTLHADGTVTVEGHSDWLSYNDESGYRSYMLNIPNDPKKQLIVAKVDSITDRALANASFALYLAADYDDAAGRPNASATPVASGVTDGDGLLDLGSLALGEYRLVETAAPAGYNPLSSAIHLSITATGVSAVLGEQSMGMEYHTADGHWQLKVPNSSGYELPATGGSGTALYTWLGLALVALALTGLLFLRRRKKDN